MPTVLKTKTSLLPREPIVPTGMPRAPKILVVAPPGFGKTEFAASNPKCIQLLCEEGHADVGGFKIRITSWDKPEEPSMAQDGIIGMSFVQARKELQKMEDMPYDFASVDTLDALLKMLVDEKLPTLRDKDGKRVQDLSDIGYGKGWNLGQNNPFRSEINNLVKIGLGVIFNTHEEIATRSYGKGETAKKETTLPTGIWKIMYPMVDSVIHGAFGKKRKGMDRRDRIFVTEGSEHMLAKNRYGALPAAWVVTPDRTKRWKEFKSFWNNPEKRDEAFKQFQAIGYDLDSF